MKKIFMFLACCFMFVACDTGTIFVSPIVSGVLAWKNGEATKYYESDTQTLYYACKRVCEDLNYKITKDTILKHKKHYLVAGENDRFKITISPAQKNISSVKIRINIMGDKPYAELFYKNLDDEVKIINFNREGNRVLFNKHELH